MTSRTAFLSIYKGPVLYRGPRNISQEGVAYPGRLFVSVFLGLFSFFFFFTVGGFFIRSLIPSLSSSIKRSFSLTLGLSEGGTGCRLLSGDGSGSCLKLFSSFAASSCPPVWLVELACCFDSLGTFLTARAGEVIMNDAAARSAINLFDITFSPFPTRTCRMIPAVCWI